MLRGRSHSRFRDHQGQVHVIATSFCDQSRLRTIIHAAGEYERWSSSN
jgi:hypothetical protein